MIKANGNGSIYKKSWRRTFVLHLGRQVGWMHRVKIVDESETSITLLCNAQGLCADVFCDKIGACKEIAEQILLAELEVLFPTKQVIALEKMRLSKDVPTQLVKSDAHIRLQRKYC